MKMRLRKEKKGNWNLITLIIFLIIFLTNFMFNRYSSVIAPKLIKITEFDLDRFTNKAIINKFDKNLIRDKDINNILKINKNDQGEIVSIDYDIDTTYKYMSEWLNSLYVDIYDMTLEIEYYDKDFSSTSNAFIVSYPIGLASNNLFINNLGPRIPIKINLLSNVISNIKTKISTYGINTLLIEMYVIIDINHQIVAGKVEDCHFRYEVLIASKIIQGTIPNYYGGVIERNSGIVS